MYNSNNQGGNAFFAIREPQSNYGPGKSHFRNNNFGGNPGLRITRQQQPHQPIMTADFKKYPQPKAKIKSDTTLYIQNIPLTYPKEQLFQLFSKHGQVTVCELVSQKTKPFLKWTYGFVTMKNAREAQIAMTNLNGYTLEDGSSIKVSNALLNPRDTRLGNSTSMKDPKNTKDHKRGVVGHHQGSKPLVHFQLPPQGKHFGSKFMTKSFIHNQHGQVSPAWIDNTHSNDNYYENSPTDKKYPSIGRGRGIIKESKPPGVKAVWLNGKESRFIEGENGELVLALGRGAWVHDQYGL